MSGDRNHSERPLAEEGATPVEPGGRSGEGSNTALEALIRKRKLQGEAADDSTDLPPAPAMP